MTRDISSSLSEFDAPFLVQHGKEDKVTDPKLSQALYDESKSKDKTIKLYDGKSSLSFWLDSNKLLLLGRTEARCFCSCLASPCFIRFVHRTGMWHSLLNGEPAENIDLVIQDTISWILERAE